MARRGDRFRRLRTPGTADLFEHFGVPIAPSSDPEPGPVTVTAATPCDHCQWFRPLPVRGPCPLCGAPGRENKSRP